MRREDLAALLDHTLLKPEASRVQIADLCEEATALGCHSVCVTSVRVAEAAESLLELGSSVQLCTVVGFPSGAQDADVKAQEAASAVGRGATEVDMVVNLGAIKDGDYEALASEIRGVRQSIGDGIVLKTILETGALSRDEITRAAEVSVLEGADFVKTSTGFHPSGGATVEAVQLLRNVVGADVGVKASGGIRDIETAMAMIDAGASRIGASASRAILDGASD